MSISAVSDQQCSQCGENLERSVNRGEGPSGPERRLLWCANPVCPLYGEMIKDTKAQKNPPRLNGLSTLERQVLPREKETAPCDSRRPKKYQGGPVVPAPPIGSTPSRRTGVGRAGLRVRRDYIAANRGRRAQNTRRMFYRLCAGIR